MSSLLDHIERPDFSESVLRKENLLGVAVEESDHDVFPERKTNVKEEVSGRRERR